MIAVVLPRPVGQRYDHVWFIGMDPPNSCRARRLGNLPLRASSQGVGAPDRNSPGEGVGQNAEEPNAFLVWLFAKAGLDARTYRFRFLERRIAACLRTLRVGSTELAKAALERQPELIRPALDAVLIGVSSFFRDEAVFERLRGAVLPELVKDRGGLRVCSVGCSEGQELYSVAMLLDELGSLQESHLIGLDCRAEAITMARAGRFDAAELEGVPLEFRGRYFQKENSALRVAPRLRARVQWQEANCLLWDYGQAAWDLILFRNVAIYLKPEEMRAVWARLVAGLRPGGVLVTGKAEQPPKELPLQRVCRCIHAARME